MRRKERPGEVPEVVTAGMARESRERLGWERQRETGSQIDGETDRVERGKEAG